MPDSQRKGDRICIDDTHQHRRHGGLTPRSLSLARKAVTASARTITQCHVGLIWVGNSRKSNTRGCQSSAYRAVPRHCTDAGIHAGQKSVRQSVRPAEPLHDRTYRCMTGLTRPPLVSALIIQSLEPAATIRLSGGLPGGAAHRPGTAQHSCRRHANRTPETPDAIPYADRPAGCRSLAQRSAHHPGHHSHQRHAPHQRTAPNSRRRHDRARYPACESLT